ncbi:MAG TPA: type VI secretion system tip protein TssI/VgrG, partial [Polyangiaceae bacterium]|nr:type VI secretion system tip protein TssI/VgrG [Polyangiaceae bacterium]
MPTTTPVVITPPPPLQPGDMYFRTMFASEALSRCFEYVVEVTSPRSDVQAEDVLGAPTTVTVTRPDGVNRYFNGLVARFDYLGTAVNNGPSRYRLVLRPWFWLLTRTADCRIFQNQSVVDIITIVFQDFDFAAVDTTQLSSSQYPKREYTVQYRETDFHFLTRLMEEEGIYYYFRHESGKHTLVLVDDPSEHQMPEQTGDSFSLPYQGPDVNRAALTEYVSEWSSESQVEPEAYAHTSFDFTKSRASLLSRQSADPGHSIQGLEVFDYPGSHSTQDVGSNVATQRLEACQQEVSQSRGWTNARALAVGYLFVLTDHPRDAENGTYLVTSATYQIRGQDAESGGAAGDVMSVVFQAIEQGLTFHLARTAYKPRIGGPQTAVVVGPSQNEIYTDQYGRVKVQFHWDRRGESNEDSSCFIRVSQAWAGTNFGAIFTPRIGQEVIVDFLEGDPDRPIITGRVYNDQNMPPYKLTDHQTQSGFKTHSSKGGTLENYNEIRFEDLKGAEELHI